MTSTEAALGERGDAVEDLHALARRVLDHALPGEQVEVLVSRATSTTVKVYEGEVESLTSADSSGAGIRVISGGRLGFAHCGTLESSVLLETLADARDNMAFGAPDEFNGLAEPDGVPVVAREGWSDAVVSLPVDRKIELALDLERRVRGADPRIVGARSTAYGDAWGESVILSTAGIDGYDRSASCSISTQPLSSAFAIISSFSFASAKIYSAPNFSRMIGPASSVLPAVMSSNSL